jgi:arylsulfatase A-like enzyme
MAANGLRFERFYAGGPVCSPTRATVMTGRSHDRTGAISHGYPLRLQERTAAQGLKAAGYVTGHFGKWHLNGHAGPGVPMLADDPRHPGRFGFDEWVSVSNFFDQDPLLSRQGKFEEQRGDSSEVIVAEAIKFLERHRGAAHEQRADEADPSREHDRVTSGGLRHGCERASALCCPARRSSRRAERTGS